MIKKWIFDETVSNIYKTHVRQHIPNYDRVIDKSISVCQKLCNKNDSIIDVGCATGHTLKLLSAAGFVNLTGVDNSQSMLDQCKVDAKLICSDSFPCQRFDGIICNWTLHFIKNKKEYLTDIYNGLNSNGLLIISDKTSNDPLPTHFYHNFKRSAGISEQDILLKAQSLKSVMTINSPEWYLKTLTQQGFKTVYIADADWCFTTFVCIK